MEKEVKTTTINYERIAQQGTNNFNEMMIKMEQYKTNMMDTVKEELDSIHKEQILQMETLIKTHIERQHTMHKNKEDETNTPGETYAEKVTKQKRNKKTTNLVKITKVVEGKKIEGTKLKESLIKEINPTDKEWGQGIQAFRRAREGVFVEMKKEEQIKQILNDPEIKEKGFQVVVPRKRQPRIIIHDIPITEDDSRIIKRIQEITNKEEEWIHGNCRIAFSMKRQDRKNLILIVHPELRKTLVEQGRIRISWVSCRVEDYVAAPQCNKCLALGHTSKWCKGTIYCIHCGEKGHIIKDCPKKETASQCANCKGNHKSRDRNCPVIKAATRAWTKSIDYGT